MAIGTGIAMLVSGLSAGGASAYGAKKASSSAKNASRIQQQENEKAMAMEREALAEQRRQFDSTQEFARKAHDAEQAELARRAALDEERYAQEFARDENRYREKENRLQPFRQAGATSMADLAGLASQAINRPAPQIAPMQHDPYAVMDPNMVPMRSLVRR